MSPDPRIIARGGRDVGPMPYVRAGFGEPYLADGALDCRQILFDSTRAGTSWNLSYLMRSDGTEVRLSYML